MSLATVHHCFDSQDILYRTLVAPRSLSAPTLRFLSAFFAKKANSIPLDATLTRLLEPILWRHLKVLHTNRELTMKNNITLHSQAPNEVVRLNTCDMLLAAYPLDITSLASIQVLDTRIRKNIAKGTMDPRVEFILPKSYCKFKHKS